MNQGYIRYMPLPSFLYITVKLCAFIGYRFLDTKLLGCISGALCIGLSLAKILQMQYYHNIDAEKVNLLAFCSLLCLCVIELIKSLLSVELQSMIIVPIVMIGYIASKAIIGAREKLIVNKFKSFLVSSEKDYSNIINLMLYLQTASSRYLISREYLIRYIGICQIYSLNCSQNKSDLHDALRSLTSSTGSKMNSVSQLHFSFVTSINNIFNEGIKQGKKNSKLLLAYAAFLVWSQINTLQSFLIIKGINEKELSFLECYHLAVIKEHNKKLFAINFDDSQNYSRVILFENRWKSFKAMITQSAALFEGLWFLLLGSNPDLKVLLSSVAKINANVENIEKLWDTIVSHEASSNKAIILYSRFERWLMNDLERAYSLYGTMHSLISKKSALQIIKENSKYKICSKLKKQGIAFVCVSTLINKLGIITACNMATCRLFGCTKAKIIGNHMNVLLPNIYHNGHAQVVNCREKPKSEHHLDCIGYIKHSSGYFQKINKSFADSPSLMNGSEYIIAMELPLYKSEPTSGYLITDTKFIIEGITSEMIRLLNLNKNQISSIYDITEAVNNYDKTLVSQSCDGVYYNRESIIMHSDVIGYSIEAHLDGQIPAEKLLCKHSDPMFEFAYSENVNRFVRQYKSNLEKEESISVKIANPLRNDSIMLSETDKKTGNSNFDESTVNVIKCIECISQQYFIEMLMLVKVIAKYNPHSIMDIKERINKISKDYSSGVEQYKYNVEDHKFCLSTATANTENELLNEIIIKEEGETTDHREKKAIDKMDFIKDKRLFMSRLMDAFSFWQCKLLVIWLVCFCGTVTALNIYVLVDQLTMTQNVIYYLTAIGNMSIMRSKLLHMCATVIESLLKDKGLIEKTYFQPEQLLIMQDDYQSSILYAYNNLSATSNKDKYYAKFYVDKITKYRISLGEIYLENSSLSFLSDSIQSEINILSHVTEEVLTYNNYYFILQNSLNTMAKFIYDIMESINADNIELCDVVRNPKVSTIFSLLIVITDIFIITFLVLAYCYSLSPMAPMLLWLHLPYDYCNECHQNAEDFESQLKLNLENILDNYDETAKQKEEEEIYQKARHSLNRTHNKRNFKNKSFLFNDLCKITIPILACINAIYIVSIIRYFTFMSSVKEFAPLFESTQDADTTFQFSSIVLMYSLI